MPEPKRATIEVIPTAELRMMVGYSSEVNMYRILKAP